MKLYRDFEGDNKVGKSGTLEFVEGMVQRYVNGLNPLSVYGLSVHEYTVALGLGDEFKNRSLADIVSFLGERRKSVCLLRFITTPPLNFLHLLWLFVGGGGC